MNSGLTLKRAPDPPFVLKVSFDVKCGHFFSEANREVNWGSTVKRLKTRGISIT